MTVYVDTMEAPFGRMKMCHCWADTREELFAMMDTIGVQRKWFQRPDDVPIEGKRTSWEHFDIAQSKRDLAIKHGAVLVDMFTMSEHANRQKFLAAVAAGHWRRAEVALRFMCLAANIKHGRQP